MLGKNFMENFEQVEDTVGKMIEAIRSDQKPVVLWGTGYCLDAFIDLMEDSEIEILCLCDNNTEKSGKEIGKYTIRSWKQLGGSDLFNIVISTSHVEEIEKQLFETGFTGKIFSLPKAAYYKNSIYGYEFLGKHKNEFEKAYHLLQDECSKRVFVNLIKQNISLDKRYFEEIEKDRINGYFGTALYENDPNEVIIDVGAFNGDSIAEFLSNPNYLFKKIIAFEPDKQNFRKLESSITDSRIIAVNKGLGEKRATLSFSSGIGVSSKIDELGNEEIEVDTIDHLLQDEKVTFIKMDIEGAEAEALMGGREVIGRDRPVLAISAYHKKEDMFSLIELIKSINAGYKIYIRHTFYYQEVWMQPDVIIYAVDK